MDRAPDRRDLGIAGLLAVLALLGVVAWRHAWALWGAAGTDAAIWGLTALDLGVGAPPHAAPAYPLLVSILHRQGVELVPGALALAGVFASLVPAAVLLAARTAGASRGGALVAGLVALAWPEGMGFAQQVQPDSLTTLLMVVTGGLLAAHGRGSRWAGWAAALVGGLFPLVREHGIPVAGLTALFLARERRGWPPLLLLLATFWLAPLIVGVVPTLSPFQTPWGNRPGGALAVLSGAGPEDVPYARTLPPGPREVYHQLLASRDVLGILRFHSARALHLAWDSWWILAIGAALALVGGQPGARALMLPALSALPALIIWSQRRHVDVVVPLAFAAVAASFRPGGRARVAAAGALLGGLVLAPTWVSAWRALGPAQQSEVPRARTYAAIADWLRLNAGDRALLGGVFQDIGLYVDIPRHDPDGTRADWRTWLVSDHPPADGRWKPVYQGATGMDIYQLEPERSPRPCDGARPDPGTPHLAIARAHADLVSVGPACLPPEAAPQAPPR